MTHSYNMHPRELLPDEPPFTLESLRQLLDTKVIVARRQKMPGDAEIAELARILNVWHGHYLIEQNNRDLKKLQRGALDALETFANVLPRIKELTERFEANAIRDAAGPALLAIIRARLAEIDEAQKFVATAECFSVWVAHPSMAPDRWQWLANVLPEDFRNAMLPANPKFRCGIGHEGPLARFIAAVVPSITGEHPSVDSVCTQLKKIRKGNLSGPSFSPITNS